MLAATAAIVAGVLLGTAVVRAQKVHDSSPYEVQHLMIEDSNGTWLGVALKDVTSDQARDLKLGGEYGAFIERVEDESPAAKAGLQSGDVIVQFGGEKVRSVAELRRMVSETPAGRKVDIEVRRNGEDKTLSSTLEDRNEDAEPLLGKLRDQVWPRVNVPVYDFSFGFGGPRLGVAVDPLTEQLGAYFGVKDGKGLLVREVSSGSAAEKAGVKAGDCITKIDSAPVESANELHRALLRKQGDSREGRDVTLTIVRDRKEQTFKVHLEPARHLGREASESGMADLIHGQELADEARELAPYAQEWQRNGEELRKQLDSERDTLQDYASAARAQAEEAQKQARELENEWLDQRGHWQQELKQLQPQMKEYQRKMKDLQDSLGSDVI